MNKQQIIVETAMEIALTPDILRAIEKKFGLYAAVRAAMSTSVGGIGPLIRERIIAQAELGVNVIGVSLLYEYVWLQRWHSWGELFLERADAACFIRPVLKKMDNSLIVRMPDGRDIKTDVWEAEYGKGGKAYFLDAVSISDVVYPGAEDAPEEAENPAGWSAEMRLQQSWLLGRGTIKLLQLFGIAPDVVILSETPAIFTIHNLTGKTPDKESLFKKTKYIFNDHTPLEYAHPVWPENLMKQYKVKPEFYNSLESFKNGRNRIDITQLLVDRADGVYGVSLKHGAVMRSMPTLRHYADKIETITNGVSRDIWQTPELKDYSNLDDAEILSIKKEEKSRLVDWMWMRFKFNSVWKEEKKKYPLVFWMRRVTAYKRLDILKEIILRDNLRQRFSVLNLTILLGGRIHQTDMHSDRLVFDLLDAIQKYPEIERSVVFLNNFNVYEAPRLYKGIDAAVMISDKGKEAAATGFMKAQLNGAVVIATEDGAVPESVFFYNKPLKGVQANGFLVEYADSCPTPEGLLKAFEEFSYAYNDKEQFVKMIRSSLAQSDRVDVKRTASQMLAMYKRLKKG